ncbi:uncharacterized protein [Procambarus clarkii]|uniref:uncharacterized protein n=1 Tax=Procambarus clarkii TaxID=6728 RepID=UPI0037424F94
MDAELTCGVCSETYAPGAHDPVLLPGCGHAFCRQCLLILEKTASAPLSCPYCRVPHDGAPVSQLAVVFALLNLTKNFIKSKHGICSSHSSVIEFWCHECEVVACGHCLLDAQHLTHHATITSVDHVLRETKAQAIDAGRTKLSSINEEKLKLLESLEKGILAVCKSCEDTKALSDSAKQTEELMEEAKSSQDMESALRVLRLLENDFERKICHDDNDMVHHPGDKTMDLPEDMDRKSQEHDDTHKNEQEQGDSHRASQDQSCAPRRSLSDCMRTTGPGDQLQRRHQRNFSSDASISGSEGTSLVHTERTPTSPAASIVRVSHAPSAACGDEIEEPRSITSHTSRNSGENSAECITLATNETHQRTDTFQASGGIKFTSSSRKSLPHITPATLRHLHNTPATLRRLHDTPTTLRRPHNTPTTLRRPHNTPTTPLQISSGSSAPSGFADLTTEEVSQLPAEEEGIIHCHLEDVKCTVKSQDGREGRMEWEGGRLHIYCLTKQPLQSPFLTVQLSIVESLLSEGPEVFLDLGVGERRLGRVYIRLWGHLRRAKHFLALVLATHGRTYKGATFSKVESKDRPGECLRVSHCVTAECGLGSEDLGSGGLGSGGEPLEWGGEYSRAKRTGLVVSSSGGKSEYDACFDICTRSNSAKRFSCPFGEVVAGLQGGDGGHTSSSNF